MRRPDEHDEYLLSRLLDGDLSDAEAADLNARLECEPELRATLDAMSRIDGLLVERREDRPDVDWDQFHSQVMDRVSTKSVSLPQTLRFPAWLRVAVPVAVAASIALVITLWQSPQDVAKSPVQPMRVAYRVPTRQAADQIIVQYNRQPTRIDSGRTGQSKIQVAYMKSEELQEAIKKYDKARANRPLWHMYTIHTDTPEQAEDDFFGMSAM